MKDSIKLHRYVNVMKVIPTRFSENLYALCGAMVTKFEPDKIPTDKVIYKE